MELVSYMLRGSEENHEKPQLGHSNQAPPKHKPTFSVTFTTMNTTTALNEREPVIQLLLLIKWMN
jgi:hypothetical protein